MTLTQSQIEGIKTLFGEDVAGSDKAINTIKSKKGSLRIFNEDGTVNISKEELEKKLNKQTKSIISKIEEPIDEITNNIVGLLSQVTKEIKKLKDLKGYNQINTSFKLSYDELKKKRESLKDAEIKRLEKEIEDLQALKNKLIEEKKAK